MTQAIAYAAFEVRRTARDTRFVFFLYVMPGAIYLLYSGFHSTAREDGLASAATTMVGLACYAAMGGALYSIGPTLAAERASGWTRLLRITPLSGTSWLLAKTLQAALMTLPGIAVVALLAVLLRGVHPSAGHLAAMLGVLVIGSVPFSMIAMIIGQALDGQASNTGTLLLLILLSFVGGILVPDSALPHSVRDLAQAFPSTQLATSGRHALAGNAVPVRAVLVLAAWALGAAALALALHRRDEAGA